LQASKAGREWRSKTEGLLRSKVLSTEKLPSVALGQSKLVWAGDPAIPVFVAPATGEAVVFLRLIEGEARVSMNVRDQTGMLLLAMKDNRWFVPPSESYDRNFNDDTLELVDSRGNPIFQVRIRGHEAQVAGVLYDIHGKPITFLPWLNVEDGRPGSFFRYPSRDHPGELTPPGP
jgi:hypothetical protein